MHNNAEEFIATFNKMEKWLKDQVGTNKQNSYKDGLNKMKEKNPVIKRYYDELDLYREIRNLMIHEKTNPNYYVTYPSDETVENLKAIYEKVTDPPKVIPKYQRNVVTFRINDSLSLVLNEVKKNKYTNFPVYTTDDKFCGVLTDNGITNWLSENIGEDILLISETKVKDVLSMEEQKSNYRFIDRNKTVYDARDIFENQEIQLDALLITQNGRESEKLLGIITAWDIVDIK